MTQLEQVNAIHSFLRVIFADGDLIEIRGLKSDHDGTLSVVTDDLHLAARTASSMETRGADVYYTLNPISRESDLMTRIIRDAPSRHVGYGATTGDKDIASRNLYLIDIDPKRPTGTAATEEQRAAAMATAKEVRTFLAGRGWPDPIMLDSGNGVHLLYRGNHCSPDGTDLTFALRHLNSKFGTSCAIDKVVANPSRIARMPHCLNKKARRRASIISQPSAFSELPPWLILRLAEENPAFNAPRLSSTRSTNSQTLLLDEDGVLDLIAEFPDHLELAGDPMYRDDAAYFPLASCPFKGAPHNGQNAGMGKTAIILRPDSIGFNCFSNDCSGHTFGGLLKLLHSKTGRWPSMEIWEDDLPELEEAWGGVEDVSPRTSRLLSSTEFARLIGATLSDAVAL